MTTPNKSSFKQVFAQIVALLLLVPAVSHGQTAVSAWTLTNNNPGNTTNVWGSYNFDNQVNTVTSITVGTSVKTVSSMADDVFIRRSAAAGNNANMWEVATSASNLTATDPSGGTLHDVLLSNNSLMGVNDLFTNTGGSPTTVNNNIERVDYYWAGGYTAVSDQGFAVFDRSSTHDLADGFQVAVITGWNTTTNEPTAYGGNVKEVRVGATSKYGTALDYSTAGGSQPTFTYQILRFTNTAANPDSLATITSADSTSSQSIFGVFISFADLGIAKGTMVYGYSIMAVDATDTVANLVDWNNISAYPTTTPDTGTTNGGSIDLLAVNGQRWIPEPSTYGAMFLGLGSLMLGFRRWRQAQGSAA